LSWLATTSPSSSQDREPQAGGSLPPSSNQEGLPTDEDKKTRKGKTKKQGQGESLGSEEQPQHKDEAEEGKPKRQRENAAEEERRKLEQGKAAEEERRKLEQGKAEEEKLKRQREKAAESALPARANIFTRRGVATKARE
jgi:hypothetical protein